MDEQNFKSSSDSMSVELKIWRIQQMLKRRPASPALHLEAISKLEELYKCRATRPAAEQILRDVIKDESIHTVARKKAEQILKDQRFG